MDEPLKAPFPWFGGKSRVAHLVWPRLGDPLNYVEPFAGSLAVLLGRPTPARTETVNDIDCFLANFWRAHQADPAGGAAHCDWPVNEGDLHPRHQWLVTEGIKLARRCYDDPFVYDLRVAGWWVWGISQWIGSGWCTIREQPVENRCPHISGAQGIERVGRSMPHVSQGSRGIISAGSSSTSSIPSIPSIPVEHRRPRNKPAGIDAVLCIEKIPNLTSGFGTGTGVCAKRPDIAGRRGHMKGIHRLGSVHPHPLDPLHPCSLFSSLALSAGTCADRTANILAYLQLLADRLRNIRVCCGDWSRITTKAVTWGMGITGVFLDPPYPGTAGRDRDIYTADDYTVAHDAFEWAVANGDNKLLRIAFCGYEGTHDFPATWTCLVWKTSGGYANRKPNSRGRINARRERIWFSPHCLTPSAGPLFEEAPNVQT